MSNIILFSPLDQFEINTLIAIYAPLLGHIYISITNLGLFTALALVSLGGLFIYGDNDFAIVPSR